MKRPIFIMLITIFYYTSVPGQTPPERNHLWQSDNHTMKSITRDRSMESMDKPTSEQGTIPLMPGWPVKVGLYPQDPVTADLDNDGKKEVIIADRGPYDGLLHVFTCNGEYFSSAWPKRLGNSLSSPAIADVDNDGILEIIVVEGTDFYSSYWPNGRVHVLKPDGSYIDGWPFLLDGAHCWINSVSVGDINLDGKLDIITATGSSYGSGNHLIIYWKKIYAFNSDGTLLPGWPAEPDAGSGMERQPRSPLVLVDLDQDSYLEILSGALNALDPNGNRNAIYALNHDGTTMQGFPINTESWNYALASADMDGDGVYEIYSHGIRYTNTGRKDHTWKEQQYVVSPLAFADVNQDGLPELIYGSGNRVHVVDKDGNELHGWPVVTREDGDLVDGNPVAGDIDGDGDIEVLIGSYKTNNVFAWHHDGRPVDGFPVTTTAYNSRITISDLDGDGDIELISACSDSMVYVWDIPSNGPCTNMEWPMFQHDEWHTGVYPNSSTAVADQPHITPPAAFKLYQNYPNPFNGNTRIPYYLSTRSKISLTVYDLRGRTVCSLVQGVKSAGIHEAVWRGRTNAGDSAVSGVYIIVLQAGETIEIRKVVLVK